MKIEKNTVVRVVGVMSLGAVMMLSMACKNGGSGSASLPAMSLASTIDQGAVSDESSGIQTLRMMSPAAEEGIPLSALIDGVKKGLGVKGPACVPGEGRSCLDAAPASGAAPAAKAPHRDVHSAQGSDKSGTAGRAK